MDKPLQVPISNQTPSPLQHHQQMQHQQQHHPQQYQQHQQIQQQPQHQQVQQPQHHQQLPQQQIQQQHQPVQQQIQQQHQPVQQMQSQPQQYQQFQQHQPQQQHPNIPNQSPTVQQHHVQNMSQMNPPPQRIVERYTPQQEREIERAIQALKEKGKTENDPEFVALLKIWKEKTNLPVYSAGVPRPPLPAETNFPISIPRNDDGLSVDTHLMKVDTNGMTEQQIKQLQSQIMASKFLSKNMPLPPSLQLATEGLQSKIPPTSVDHSGVPIPTENLAEARRIYEQKVLEAAKKKDEAMTQQSSQIIYSKTVQGKRYIVPSKNPVSLNPQVLLQTRETNIQNRIKYRIQELENLPSNIPQNLKIKALIELKALRLLEFQTKLREEVVHGMKKGTTLETSVNKTAYKKVKKPTVKEARLTEKIEKQQQIDQELRERQRRQQRKEFLETVCAQSKTFKEFHRSYSSKFTMKLGKMITTWHTNVEREEARKLERKAKERLRILKMDDEEAYIKLIDTEKDKRITHLLQQTDQYLAELGQKVADQKKDVKDDITKEDLEDLQERKDFYQIAHSIHEKITRQPAIIEGGKLKEYQLKGLEWMVSLYNNNLNGILADEMGLGKTIQTIALVSYLMEEKQQLGPYLIIVPLSTLTNWQLEFEKWTPSVNKIVYIGSPAARKNLQGPLKTGKFNVLLTTYDFVMKDRNVLSKIKWTYLIIDEGHRMKNAHCKLTQTLQQYYTAKNRLLLTGTPLQNSLPELWALLNFLLPLIFRSVKSFEDWFNAPFANTGEQLELNEEETLLVIRRLHKVLRPFMLRRLKKDVESELPDKVERVLKCHMSSIQRKVYKQLKNNRSMVYTSAGDDKDKKIHQKGLNNVVMQLRKICNHPYVFREIEDQINTDLTVNLNLVRCSGKFELLDRMLPKFKRTGHKVLIFFQMTQVIEIMQDYCNWKGYPFLRLDGGTKNENRREAMEEWNRPDSKYFIFLLSTRAGGLGLNLQSADTVIIFDSDWNPHQDLQAQDRAHRIGQKSEVRVYRLVTAESIEEHILARAQYKLNVDHKVIQAGKFDQKSTAEERDLLLRALLEEDNQENEEDDVFDDEELNEIISRNDEEFSLFQKIDLEIEQQRLEEWRKLRMKGVPSRLMESWELPELYVREEEMNLPEDIETGRGKRQPKKVFDVLDDQLSEAQWLKLIEEGRDVQEVLKKKKIAKEKRLRKREHSASESDVSTPSSIQEPPKKRRKVDSPITPKNVKRDLKVIFGELLEIIEDLEDNSGRPRALLFMELPSQADYPDYYQLIKQPIALDIIKQRIGEGYYKNHKEFSTDMELMFLNAMTYNEEGSQVYEDAVIMKRTFLSKMKQMFPKGRTPRVQTMREKPDDQTEGDNDKPRRGRGRPKEKADDEKSKDENGEQKEGEEQEGKPKKEKKEKKERKSKAERDLEREKAKELSREKAKEKAKERALERAEKKAQAKAQKKEERKKKREQEKEEKKQGIKLSIKFKLGGNSEDKKDDEKSEDGKSTEKETEKEKKKSEMEVDEKDSENESGESESENENENERKKSEEQEDSENEEEGDEDEDEDDEQEEKDDQNDNEGSDEEGDEGSDGEENDEIVSDDDEDMSE